MDLSCVREQGFLYQNAGTKKKKKDLDQFSIKAKLISDEHLIRSLHFLCR